MAIILAKRDLLLVRDVARLSEDEVQLEELLSEHGQRVKVSRDDRHH